MAAMCSSLPRMWVFSGSRVMGPQRSVLLSPVVSRRGAVQVVAAEQNKKRTDSAVKRAQLAEERHMRNKSRKSAIATYMKKVWRGQWSHIECKWVWDTSGKHGGFVSLW